MGEYGCLHLKCVAGLQVGYNDGTEDAEQWRRCVAPTDALGVTHGADVRVTLRLRDLRAPSWRPCQMPTAIMPQPEIAAVFLEKFHVATLHPPRQFIGGVEVRAQIHAGRQQDASA